MNTIWTIRKLLGWTTEWFAGKGIPSARLDAELLLAHTLSCSRLDLYLTPDKPVDDAEKTRFKSLIKRRSRCEPVAYITGQKEFWSRSFRVTSDVLIPRPETERLVEITLALMDQYASPRIVELGTGSGCIAITLALERPDANILAGDISGSALDVARSNAAALRAGDRIQFYNGSWFDGIEKWVEPASIDLVVSNPPYIRSADVHDLQPDIRDYEPVSALDGGNSGVEAYHEIAEGAAYWLRPGGRLVLEIGYNQAEAVESVLSQHQFRAIDIHTDAAGRDRVIAGIKGEINAGT